MSNLAIDPTDWCAECQSYSCGRLAREAELIDEADRYRRAGYWRAHARLEAEADRIDAMTCAEFDAAADAALQPTCLDCGAIECSCADRRAEWSAVERP